MYISSDPKAGFTLIEVLVALAIIIILATVIMSVFINSKNSVALTSAVETTHNILEDARTRALYTIPESSFGVRVGSTTLELFKGAVYDANEVVREAELSEGVVVSALNLTGGGVDIVYNAVIASVDASGTLTLENTGNSATTTLEIHESGLTNIK